MDECIKSLRLYVGQSVSENERLYAMEPSS